MINDVKKFIDNFVGSSYVDVYYEGSSEEMRNVRNDSGMFHIDEKTSIVSHGIEVESCLTRGYKSKDVFKGLSAELRKHFDFDSVYSSEYVDTFIMREDNVSYTVNIWNY